VQTAVHTLRDLNIVAYTALGAVALLLWRRRRRDRAAMWAAAAFTLLAAVELLSLVPNHSGNRAEGAVARVEILLLVLFPYLLFRFTGAFRRPGQRLANALIVLTAALVVWTYALRSIPRSGEHWPPVFAAFVVVFLVHWAVLSSVSATRLWRAGSGQPTVSRRRLRLMAAGAGSLTLALLLAASTRNTSSALSLGSEALATLSVLTFLVGFAPPRLARMAWRREEQERVQQAIQHLLAFAESQEEVAHRVLEPAAAIVGARALAIRNAEGRVVASWNVGPENIAAVEGEDQPRPGEDAEVIDVDFPGGRLVVWTSPYAPFFGDEELALLQTVGALTGLALDRVRLYQAEHSARVALERANEVKLDFIALAAHELRTPMTTIHGFVTTLHHLGDQLGEDQRRQVNDALLQQTDRMARLVEQLLDLSRLDAEAIEIAPEPIALRPHLEEIVAAAAPDPAAVEIDVPEKAIATVDRNALDRIVTNLVTNAFRYGRPPIVLHAEQTDRHFRLSVEDSGHGVPPEFVPDLFERFSRSERSREQAGGTGLGLAIARSYARAHGGDLLYEDADPHGARFHLVLPSRR
jgi:signal transduction histidine kinase